MTDLVRDASGGVAGVRYTKEGKTYTELGPVVIATGGFAADFSPDGVLASVRPDLLHLPTTNGEHCTGDGIKMSLKLGAATVDMARRAPPAPCAAADAPAARRRRCRCTPRGWCTPTSPTQR